MAKFKRESRNWTDYRALAGVEEFDLHFSDLGPSRQAYWQDMEDVYRAVLKRLKELHGSGDKKFLLICHGSSTSHRGKTTSRSQVRKLMRGPDATPYIVRRECVQHPTVFLAAIRPKG